MKAAVIFAALVFAQAIAAAADVYVPDDYPRIQDAIVAVEDGDTIVVRPGTYFENIDFLGKIITVTSSQGPALTVIDGGTLGAVVTFEASPASGAVLAGFTITNGLSSYGGGISCIWSSPTIRCNTIKGNSATYHGGGVYVRDGAPTIACNKIEGNSASIGGGIFCHLSDSVIANNVVQSNAARTGGSGGCGGGIYCGFSSLTIRGNVIAGNSAGSYSRGGGIMCHGSPFLLVVNNVIHGNTAGFGGGIGTDSSSPRLANNTITGNIAEQNAGGACFTSHSHPLVCNTIVWDNGSPLISAVGVDEASDAEITDSDIEGGWPGSGNIDVDPLFVDAAGGDFHLTFHSPCRNAGNDEALPPGIEGDFEGDPRISDGALDLGADEFHPHLYHVGPVSPGQNLTIAVIGEPGTTPVRLLEGAGVRSEPYATAYGDLFLLKPIRPLALGAIAADGVLTIKRPVPAAWSVGERHPFQVLLGPMGNPDTVLTNLDVLEVE